MTAFKAESTAAAKVTQEFCLQDLAR